MPTCSDPNPLRRDGLSQTQRRLPALDPASIRLDERSADELLAFAADYADAVKLRFYPLDQDTPAADFALPGNQSRTVWQTLMTPPGGQSLAELEARTDVAPHLALFLAFLKLFGLAQEQLNAFTQRHLDFYYRDVLRLSGRPAVPDQVHLTFELARNVAEQVLPAGTEYEADSAGDADHPPLRYQQAAERVVNRVGLARLRAIYLPADPDDATQQAPTVHFAPNPATADGVAAELPATDPSWSAFGSPAAATVWPEAELGFALAAPVLRLAEGRRVIKVTLPAKRAVSLPATDVYLRVQLSGTNAWVEPAKPVKLTYNPRTSVYSFEVRLEASEKQAVVNYDAAVLGGGYVTSAPVLRALLADSRHYSLLREVSLNSVQVDVQVTGLRQTLVLENDLGPLVPGKPFLPFGPVPTAQATLYVDCPELADKTVSSLTVRVPAWLGKPDTKADSMAWNKYYTGYDGQLRQEDNIRATVLTPKLKIDKPLDFALFGRLQGGLVLPVPAVGYDTASYAQDQVDDSDVETAETMNFARRDSSEATTAAPTDTAARANTAATDSEATIWRSAALRPLKSDYNIFGNYYQVGSDFVASSPLTDYVAAAATPTAEAEHLLTFTLSQDLGQRDYPTLLAAAVAEKVKDSSTAIPNPPYAPLAKELTLDYAASTGMVVLDYSQVAKEQEMDENFARRPVQLFHHSVFGQAEEHVYLKHRLGWLPQGGANNSTLLLPQLATGGTLLLGLSEVRPRDTVAVLFQVAEGSANPAREAPVRVAWSALSQNQWYPLQGTYAPLDHTQHLLTSGIIEFRLPAEARTDNTLLDSGLVWLKGELELELGPDSPFHKPAPPDSVARLVALHPQAVLARLAGPPAEPAHYAAPLPAGTLTRVRQGSPGLRVVRQPYPSFGGQPAEAPAAFYTRVSERLRHKQRAVSIWDYEHLVLEKFPSLYKVQCLNHTRVAHQTDGPDRLLERAPGYVTLVVVPSLRYAYAANSLEPRVARRTLEAVGVFAQAHAGQQVQVQAVNPTYEPVQVGAQVAFRAGYPAPTYLARLNQDVCNFLAPWATASAELTLGGTLHKSTLLAFIEQLPYVDFVTELTLHVKTEGRSTWSADQETVEASSARAVLGSAPAHVFTVLSTSPTAIVR